MSQRAVPASFYQCRVTPHIKSIKKHSVNYDSTLIFTTPELAEAYMSAFLEQLLTLGLITAKDSLDTNIIQLATYIPEILGDEKEKK